MARGQHHWWNDPPWWAWVAIVVGTVVLLVGTPIAVHRGPVGGAAGASPPATAAPVTPTSPTVEGSVALLGEAGRPWTLAVFGDSTGNADDEWVYLLAAQLSAKYDRPVVIHDWSVDANSYSGETPVGDGSNAPITIWNGSASGQSAGYSLSNFATIAPQQPDLAIVSHGHNETSVRQAIEEVDGLLRMVATAWPQRPAVALVLQSPRLDADAARQDQVVEALRARYTGGAVSLIDVHAAFRSRPSLPDLLSADLLHPNAAGEQLWAETVEAALGVA